MKIVTKPAWLDAGTGISLSTQKWGTIPNLYAVIAWHLRVEKLSLFKKLRELATFLSKIESATLLTKNAWYLDNDR